MALVLEYALNEGSGTVAKDSSGNGLDGVTDSIGRIERLFWLGLSGATGDDAQGMSLQDAKITALGLGPALP